MKKNSFVEGTLIATLSIVLVKILGMLYVIPFYAIVGSKGGALYSYAYSIYLIFLGISSAGLPDAVSKIIAEYSTLGLDEAKNRTYKIGKKITFFVALAVFLVLFIFANQIGVLILGDLKGGNTPQDVAFVIRCVAPAVLLIPFLSMMKGYLQGHKFIAPASTSQLIEQFVRIFVILVGSYLALNIFNGTLKLAVGIAVSGAFFGGLIALLYLKRVINKNKKDFVLKTNKKDDVTDKVIVRKIIKYAIPFIIISIVSNVYNFTDQVLVLRTLNKMGFSAADTELVASSITTWSSKICMIINAMASGMTMSLVPTIVSAITKKDTKEVEDKVNKSITMIIFISLPLSLGLAILSTSVWTIFYSPSIYGSVILKYEVICALFGNLFMIVSAIIHSLNKFKLVYTVSICGFLTNLILDIPLMYLFKNLGFYPFLGSVFASMIGYSVSILIGLLTLRRENKISYRKTAKNIGLILIPAVIMSIVVIIIHYILPFDELSKTASILRITIEAIIGGLVYIIVSFKSGIIYNILGKEMVNNLIKKLTLGKFKIKD